jgi:CRISPR-associated endonuclease Csn1
MTPCTLGLDLGSNSIGWALVNEEQGKLLAAGVRVFPEGVDRDQQGGEQSKNEQRRIARGMRRQIARRARRKQLLRKALVEAGLLPELALLPRETPERVAWETEQFQRASPYNLRRRALTERLDPHEIGRVLLHLNQRRGFLSNRKSDKARKKETQGMLKEISDLANEMGDKTLGQHLAEVQLADPHGRLRGRHTQRTMLQQEFEAIWTSQQSHHPTLLTDNLKYGSAGKQSYPREPETLGDSKIIERFGLYGVIFFQRPMYWPKWVVGQCELEPKQKRCPRADRVAQRFRLLQEVNNLRLLDSTQGDERPLIADERKHLLAILAEQKEMEFAKIRKKLGFLENVRFNLERGDRKKLDGMKTDATLASSKLFGKAWHKRPDSEKNAVVRTLLDDRLEDAEKLRRAKEEWGLSAEAAELLLDVDLPEGHASLSRLAIEKLLPYMERGLPLMTRDGTPCALAEAGYLRRDQQVVNQQPLLPLPPEVTNPLVRQALHEVRKLVNAVIREYGIPARIHIELAREVKGTAEDRERRTKEMRSRERNRDEAAKRIREQGVKVTRDAIDRYLLWEEQRHECVYSGRPISINQLLAGEIHEDHVLPYPRSLDNSLMNRVVCFRDENDAKRDRTPHEWLAAADSEKYDAILQRADKLPYAKARKFREKDIKLDDFIARQLVDTAYITRKVTEYVGCLGADVICTKGQLTAELRWQWGLDSVLRDDGLHLKNREDHRHHAVDAIVIALTNRSRLQQLARIRRHGGTARTGEVLPDPWTHFRTEVETLLSGVRVSHRVERKIRGALHEDTIYGPTAKPDATAKTIRPWAKGWVEKEGVFVCRKPVEQLTAAMIDDIRDTTIREMVLGRLKAHGVDLERAKSIPKEVWKEPLRMPSGVPVKKVRILRSDLTIQPIRGGTAYVKPGSLHHLCIFEYTDEKGKVRREAEFVSMLQAVERLKRREPLIQRVSKRTGAKFVMSLSAGEMVLATFKGCERLVHLATAASTQGQLYFVDHADARRSGEAEKLVAKANTLNGRKVTVDLLGRIRWAND